LADGWNDPVPPVDLAAVIEAPLAVVHGRNDAFIKSAEGRKLHDAATEPRRLELVDRMGHAYVPESVPPIRSAVDWALRASASVTSAGAR
jgi:fermentation-respiration switch protein FrsA (DUF1100 family)